LLNLWKGFKILLGCFPLEKVSVNSDQNIDWDTFWAIFLKTHMVTLTTTVFSCVVTTPEALIVATIGAIRVTRCVCEKFAPKFAQNSPQNSPKSCQTFAQNSPNLVTLYTSKHDEKQIKTHTWSVWTGERKTETEIETERH
jgi:hypothetical protein